MMGHQRTPGASDAPLLSRGGVAARSRETAKPPLNGFSDQHHPVRSKEVASRLLLNVAATPPRLRRGVFLAILTAILALPSAFQSQQPKPAIQYVDITKAAGLTYRHNSGATGKKYLPETLGPGVAFI